MIYPRMRQAALMVAAVDAPSWQRAAADYNCDGASDDVQINAALAAAVAAGGGGVVQLSAGAFSVTNSIQVPSNATLRGMGYGTLLTLSAHTGENLDGDGKRCMPFLRNSDRSGGNANIVLENFRVNGNRDNQATVGTSWALNDDEATGNRGCIDLLKVTRLRVSGLWVYEAYAVGIELQRCVDAVVTGNYVEKSTDDAIGINLVSYRVTVTDNTCLSAGDGYTAPFWGGPSGIEVQDGCYLVTVANNLCSNNLAWGVDVNTHPAFLACHDITITGNVCVDNGCVYGHGGGGIDVSGISGAEAYNVVISGNVIRQTGVEDAGPVNSALYSCMGLGYANRVVVSNNVLYSIYSGSLSNADGHAMTLELVSDVSIVDNVFSSNSGKERISAISVSAYSSSRVTIRGNQFKYAGSWIGLRFISGTYTLTDWDISDNLFMGVDYALRFNHATAITFTTCRFTGNRLAASVVLLYRDGATPTDSWAGTWEVRGNFGYGASIGAASKYEQTFERLKNVSGGSLAAGDVVVYEPSGPVAPATFPDAVATTTTAGNPKVAGVWGEATSSTYYGLVQKTGQASVKVDTHAGGAIVLGDLLAAGATAAKYGQKAAAGQLAFAIALEPQLVDLQGSIKAWLITPRPAI